MTNPFDVIILALQYEYKTMHRRPEDQARIKRVIEAIKAGDQFTREDLTIITSCLDATSQGMDWGDKMNGVKRHEFRGLHALLRRMSEL